MGQPHPYPGLTPQQPRGLPAPPSSCPNLVEERSGNVVSHMYTLGSPRQGQRPLGTAFRGLPGPFLPEGNIQGPSIKPDWEGMPVPTVTNNNRAGNWRRWLASPSLCGWTI